MRIVVLLGFVWVNITALPPPRDTAADWAVQFTDHQLVGSHRQVHEYAASADSVIFGAT